MGDFEESLEPLEGLGKEIERRAKALKKAVLEYSGRLEGEIEYNERRHGGAETAEGGEVLMPGLLSGEDAQRYKARLERVGMAEEFPPTLERLDEIVAEAERRWQMVTALSPWEMGEVKKNWRKTMLGLLGRTALATNMDIGTLDGLLRDGEWRAAKPYGELAQSGYGSDSARKRFTRYQFGTDERMPKRDYERYGALHTLGASETDGEIGAFTGDIVVRWNPESVATTFFCGDSLRLAQNSMNYCACSLTTDPSPCSFSPESRGLIDRLKGGALGEVGLEELCAMLRVPYIELQFHGENTQSLDAVAGVSFADEDEVRALTWRAVERLSGMSGVEVAIGGRRAAIGESGEISYLDDGEGESGSGEDLEEQEEA